MKALIWWFRSAFCRHEWRVKAEIDVAKSWPPSMRGEMLGRITVSYASVLELLRVPPDYDRIEIEKP